MVSGVQSISLHAQSHAAAPVAARPPPGAAGASLTATTTHPGLHSIDATVAVAVHDGTAISAQ
jgi:hypothetical protein